MLQNYIDKLNSLNFADMYESDFFLTWEKTDDDIAAVFAVADALRSLREELPLEEDVLSIPGPGPDEALTERELAERTRRAVELMPEPDREIFLRHYYYCQGVADIALALDMNANTVKTRLRRGRERLRKELAEGDD